MGTQSGGTKSAHGGEGRMTLQWDGQTLLLKNAQKIATLTGKYLDFFCLLIAADAGAMVDRDTLVRCASWSANQPVSAGKQVARFMSNLVKNGMNPLVSTHKTHAWRLATDAHKSIDAKTRAVAKDRAVMLLATLPHSTDINILMHWYRINFQALVDMTTGKAGTGYEALRTCMNSTENEEYFAISNVLATRIEQRMADQRLPIMPSIKVPGSPLARAIEIRRNAAYAIYAHSTEWPQLEQLFRRELAQMSHSDDFTSIAILQNALGVLQRRQGHLENALAHVQAAAPLAIFSGDLILIQNVAFNLANIASEIHRKNPGAILPEGFIALLKYDVVLRDTMALGRDSAQTELLLAYLLFESGADDDARHYLAMANGIIADTQVEVDQALSHRISGLLSARSGNTVAARDQLAQARAIYAEAGYRAAAAHVDGEIAALA